MNPFYVKIIINITIKTITVFYIVKKSFLVEFSTILSTRYNVKEEQSQVNYTEVKRY